MSNKKPQNSTDLAAVNGQTGLTPIQEQAATLLAGGMSLTDVAGAVKVDRTTIYRWFTIVTFQCFLNRQAADFKENLRNGILSLSESALTTVRESLQSKNEATRLKAAMWVVEQIHGTIIGATDARAELKKENTKDILSDLTCPQFNKEDYKKSLKQYGLDDD